MMMIIILLIFIIALIHSRLVVHVTAIAFTYDLFSFLVFYTEVLENIRHGIAENVSSDNIILEVNASK